MRHKKRITQIPIPGNSYRPPTGAMQFPSDWPGLFIRGDSASVMAEAIRRLQEQLKEMKNCEVLWSLGILAEIADIIEQDVVVPTADRNWAILAAAVDRRSSGAGRRKTVE